MRSKQCLLVLSIVTLANGAFAQQIFREDFEGGAPTWNTIAGFATNPLVYQAVRTLNLVSENSNAVCSGTFQRERTGGSGGRAFASGAVQTVVVNDDYCITSWIRHRPGANIESAYLGITYTNAGGTANLGEIWLIGGNSAVKKVVAGQVNNTWHWYSQTFRPSQTLLMVKNERFASGADADVDFDDIRIFKGACPVTPPVDSGSHAACTGGTPVCNPAGGVCVQCVANADCGNNAPFCVGNACVPCNNNAIATTCGAASPVCTNSGACKACDRDFGVNGGDACPSAAAPYCNPNGTCGTCTNNGAGAQGCTQAGTSHAGAVCNVGTGACGSACNADSDCVNGYCAAAVCSAKLPNGSSIPGTSGAPVPGRANGDALLNGTCTVASGTAACLTGVCSTADNKCGYANGESCGAPNNDNLCRNGVCFDADSICGLPVGQTCASNEQCRSNSCVSALCVANTASDAGVDGSVGNDAGSNDGSVGGDSGVADGGTTDSSVRSDAGRSDAGNAPDASGTSGNGDSIEGGGYGCSTGQASSSGLAMFGAVAAAMTLSRRRRKQDPQAKL